jgi:hypothetical protein
MATRRNHCPAGQFYRKSYTRKGRRVAGRCIRKQTRGLPSRVYTARLTKRMGLRMRGFRKSLRGSKRCSPGKILRSAYVRVSRGKRAHVPASCIPDVGAEGKGLAGSPGIGPLKRGNLTQYGYEKVASLEEVARRQALNKAVAAYGALTVWRKLNALSVYTRRTSPATSRAVKADMDWVRATWGLKAF